MLFVCWILCLVGSAKAKDDLMTSSALAHLPPYHDLSKKNYTMGKDDSLFGYSIAYQKDINSLVVGAPLGNINGQVYSCPVNETVCDEVLVDSDAFNAKKDVATKWDHHSWLGATVNAGAGFLMACAPRVLFEGPIKDSIYSSGRCYYKTDLWSKAIKSKSMNHLSQKQRDEYYGAAFMITENPPYNKGQEKTTDSFGLSSYVENGKSIFIGGPAMSIGQTIFYTSYGERPKYVPVNNTALNISDKKISFNFGYSITSGNFSDGYNQIAISTPYGTIGYGRVHFYRSKDDGYNAELGMWVNGQEVTHIGSLFGASLASLRQKNRRCALLVGAPAFAFLEGAAPDFTPSQSAYDVGAVFIFTFEKIDYEPKTILIKKLLGNKEKLGGRFGASIVTVGDFDDDDIDDVAIAAPYENDGKGAVYLYSGKKLLEGGVDSSVPWLQQLLPEEQPASTKLPLFGLALNVPTDADQNGCNELAIGAPGVSAVTLFRCLASVEVSILTPEFPDLTTQAKTLKIKNNSFVFKQCLQVKEFTKPSKVQSDIKFSVHVIHPDVTMVGKNEFIKPLTPGQICERFEVLLPMAGDYDKAVKFNVSVELNQNPLISKTFNPALVLINKGIAHSKAFPLGTSLPGSKLTFKINSSLKNGYLIGSTDSESLIISVSNAGNLAHGVCVRTRLQGVTITDLPKGHNCSIANDELKCFKQKLETDWKVQLTMSTKPLTSSHKEIIISSELLKSNCNQTTDQKDYQVFTLTRDDSSITIKRYSKPDFNVNVTEEEFKKGKTIDHIYTITNYGVTTWTNVQCNISLPSQVKIEKVKEQASVKCEPIDATHTVCNITELRKNIPVNVNILMKIQPDSPFIDQIKAEKATLDTELKLLLFNTIKTASITTNLRLWKAPEVPLWMIIVASLFGLIIIAILFWVLRECGCLQRTNKEKLKELKKDIKRQTMRRSMMLRQSVIDVIPNTDATNNGDRKRLISVTEEDATSQDGGLNDGDLKNGGLKDGVLKDDVHKNKPDEDRQNEQPVKEFHLDDNDPARAAFNNELQKALAKGKKTVVTNADIH